MSSVNFNFLSSEDVMKNDDLVILKTISDDEEVLIMRYKGDEIVLNQVVARK